MAESGKGQDKAEKPQKPIEVAGADKGAAGKSPAVESSGGGAGLKDRLKAVDLELAAIERELAADTKPVMFGADGRSDLKLVHMEESPADNPSMHGYYKKMVLRCRKCEESFDHEAAISRIECELTCPGCGESHVMEFKPSSRFFTIHSKTVDVVKHGDEGSDD